jgi:hypothetical protein
MGGLELAVNLEAQLRALRERRGGLRGEQAPMAIAPSWRRLISMLPPKMILRDVGS